MRLSSSYEQFCRLDNQQRCFRIGSGHNYEGDLLELKRDTIK